MLVWNTHQCGYPLDLESYLMIVINWRSTLISKICPASNKGRKKRILGINNKHASIRATLAMNAQSQPIPSPPLALSLIHI